MVTIVEPDPSWASEFSGIAERVREAIADDALRIDHGRSDPGNLGNREPTIEGACCRLKD